MGWFLRLNVGLYTAGNPTFFTRNLPWDSTAKITRAETTGDEALFGNNVMSFSDDIFTYTQKPHGLRENGWTKRSYLGGKRLQPLCLRGKIGLRALPYVG